MKKNTLAIRTPAFIAAILLFCSVSALHAQDWVKYESAEMKFKAIFPVKPSEQEQTTPTAAGDVKLHIIMADLSETPSATNMVYMINYSEMPDSVSSDVPDKLDAVFNGAVNGMAKNVNGSLLSSKRTTYKQFPAVDAKVDMQGQATITARVILVHNKMYLLAVISAPGKDDNPDLAKFFNSFESD
ncbi:MAG TPA: hypothetical protein VHB48_07205 [Chitinophagaceae bacterium]|nr:hypothetical protein [Chitinophagaceae bacterium]